jgi:hypothetical protein
MKTYYVVRNGFNAANQSATGRTANPKNLFESGYSQLVGMVQAESAQAAIDAVGATCYNGQGMWATSAPQRHKGLTRAIMDSIHFK